MPCWQVSQRVHPLFFAGSYIAFLPCLARCNVLSMARLNTRPTCLRAPLHPTWKTKVRDPCFCKLLPSVGKTKRSGSSTRNQDPPRQKPCVCVLRGLSTPAFGFSVKVSLLDSSCLGRCAYNPISSWSLARATHQLHYGTQACHSTAGEESAEKARAHGP